MSVNQGFTEKAQQALGTAQQRTREFRLRRTRTIDRVAGAAGPVRRRGYECCSRWGWIRAVWQLRSTRPSMHCRSCNKRRGAALQCDRQDAGGCQPDRWEFGDEYTSTEHCCWRCWTTRRPMIAQLLERNGVTEDKVREALERGARRSAGDRPESGRQIPGAGEVRSRSDRAGRAGQARSGHRAG